MIIRQQRMNNDSRTCSFYCEYGAPDVKAALQLYIQHDLGGMYTIAKRYSYTEEEVITIIRLFLFDHLQEKHGRKFAKWAFRLAVKEKLIEESAVMPGTYYLSSALHSKTGRPRKEEEEEN